MTGSFKVGAVWFSGLLALAACDDKQPGAAAAAASAAASAPIDMVKARAIFVERCAACHGPDGTGNGPASAALVPKPRNYHDKAWQAKVTDEDIKKTIVYGGAAVGKSPNMVSNPDLDSKPEVVDGLVKIIREFGKQ